MRLNITDADAATQTNGGRQPPKHERVMGVAARGTNLRALLNAFRTLDGSVRETAEALRQIASGITPYVPRIRVRESANCVVVSARLFRVAENSIEVTLEGRELKIRGVKTSRRERTRRNYRSVEEVYRTFQRTIQLRCDVDSRSAIATLRNDVFRLHATKIPG